MVLKVEPQMWLLSSEANAEGTGVGNILHVNHDKTTPVSQKNYFQGPAVKDGVSMYAFSMYAFKASSIVTSCNSPTCVTDPAGDTHAGCLCLRTPALLCLHTPCTLYTCSETPQHSSPGVFPGVQWGQSWSAKPENLGSGSPLGQVKKGCVIPVSQGHTYQTCFRTFPG